MWLSPYCGYVDYAVLFYVVDYICYLLFSYVFILFLISS